MKAHPMHIVNLSWYRCHLAVFLTAFAGLLAIPALASQPRLMPSYHTTPNGPVAPGTSFTGTYGTDYRDDPNGVPCAFPATVTWGYTADASGETYTPGYWDGLSSGNPVSLNWVGAGIVVTIHLTSYDLSAESTGTGSYQDEEKIFVPLSDYFSSGISVSSSLLGYTITGLDASATQTFIPQSIKTYSHPTIWTDTLLVFTDTGDSLCFTEGKLYADGTVLETYQDASNSSLRLQVVRWQGATPSNKASLVVLPNSLPSGSSTASSALDTSAWDSNTGNATAIHGSGYGVVTFYKNYPF